MSSDSDLCGFDSSAKWKKNALMSVVFVDVPHLHFTRYLDIFTKEAGHC